MISVILPAYNEERNICFVVDEISDFFEKNNKQYEIIVVDDGSKDKTLLIRPAMPAALSKCPILLFTELIAQNFLLPVNSLNAFVIP